MLSFVHSFIRSLAHPSNHPCLHKHTTETDYEGVSMLYTFVCVCTNLNMNYTVQTVNCHILHGFLIFSKNLKFK
jgi:hypothetical protein